MIWIGKEDVVMKQIIKFVDKNVDGCGSNVDMLIQIEGKIHCQLSLSIH